MDENKGEPNELISTLKTKIAVLNEIVSKKSIELHQMKEDAVKIQADMNELKNELHTARGKIKGFEILSKNLFLILKN